MNRRVLLVGADPLYRWGIRLALETASVSPRVVEFDLQRLPSQVKRGDLLVLCLGGSAQSQQLLDEWLPANVCLETSVVLFSTILGTRHRRQLANGRVDLCLPANIGLEDTRASLHAFLGHCRPDAAVVPIAPAHFLPDPSDLSRKERQVLHLLSDGKSNRVIAEDLGIHLNTVKVHLARICRKMNFRNRTHAACQANDIFYQQAAAKLTFLEFIPHEP